MGDGDHLFSDVSPARLSLDYAIKYKRRFLRLMISNTYSYIIAAMPTDEYSGSRAIIGYSDNTRARPARATLLRAITDAGVGTTCAGAALRSRPTVPELVSDTKTETNRTGFRTFMTRHHAMSRAPFGAVVAVELVSFESVAASTFRVALYHGSGIILKAHTYFTERHPRSRQRSGQVAERRPRQISRVSTKTSLVTRPATCLRDWGF
ncbi:hypothetical protein EVAR_38373_1 [Eumeta japonica]|uniref:Uncharacterized protein n=1 Tax=Eumeta variegata TaxID=151549 RepID=A0A4C1Y0H2_EUMVA|nr:hypothetical protein EVAR_38373_1 [Eumeta japonica]